MGKLTSIGEITFEDETRTGVFIECSREELKEISKLFLEDVKIVLAQREDSTDECTCPSDFRGSCSFWKPENRCTYQMDRDINADLSKLADAFFDNLEIDNCEYGGIGLDSRRPFGNSYVEWGMLEIIGIKPEIQCPNCADEYSQEQYDYVRNLYHEKLIPFLREQHNKLINKDG